MQAATQDKWKEKGCSSIRMTNRNLFNSLKKHKEQNAYETNSDIETEAAARTLDMHS